ncbi:MAG: tetratricopeptide repeat protein [Candidatus Omnitrophica bacterium]|nr:tetratricopeptide repeat protein [Candidatus Omnitrophota bacterium]
MKKFVLMLTFLAATVGIINPHQAAAYNFGDFRSETLTTKAWLALKEGDIEAVLAYTNKCVELYGEQAKKMQSSVQAYPTGTNDEIFGFWALNDVATALFIQGEAYRTAKMNDEAKAAYNKVINEYTFGQAWDPKGWFWKPADASKEKLAMIESGSNVDFGDYTSSFLTTQAWKALNDKDDASVMTYTDKVIELYGAKATEMQGSLTEYAWESKDKIFSYWALNDVGTSLFIRGEAYKKAGNVEKAKEEYKKLVDNFFYAQCWDPNGWFWKPAEAAQQALEELNNS